MEETAPLLELDGVRRVYDGLAVVDGVSLALRAGEVTCLLGPSGCGKTTTLRVAAGVERQTSGRVLIGGRSVSDAIHHLPPEGRGIGLMFQDFALFPHLTVAANVAFGLRSDREARRHRAGELLDRVGLGRFGGQYPHQLSGGEQQRVALARALAPRPRVMLMDEPFSGLDNRLRDEIRDETLAILREEGAAVLLVTHEPGEAMLVADRIALMRLGRVVQLASPYNIYNQPADLEAAAFFSEINVIRGRVEGAQTTTPFGPFLAPGHPDGAEVAIVIRPQHLTIDFDRGGQGPAPSPQHGVWARGTVARARFVGRESLVELRMDHDGASLRASVPGVFLPAGGTALWLAMRRDRCLVFPAGANPGAVGGKPV